MKKLSSLFIFMTVVCQAQTNRFIYMFEYKTDSTAQQYKSDMMALDINPDQVKFYPNNNIINDSLNKNLGRNNKTWNNTLPTLVHGRNSFKNSSYIYYNLTFFKMISNDKMNWELKEDIKNVDGYKLQKATTDFGGRKWTAWFNSDININEGPFKFRGLPGLIFEIEDDDHYFKFKLIKNQKLGKTYDSTEFLENFVGQQPFPLTPDKYRKMMLDHYADPLRGMREIFLNSQKSSNNKSTFEFSGVKIERVEQFKPFINDLQERIKKNNNNLERAFIVGYPSK